MLVTQALRHEQSVAPRSDDQGTSEDFPKIETKTWRPRTVAQQSTLDNTTPFEIIKK